MITCSGCGALCSDNARLCPSCGRAISIPDTPTLEPRGTAARPALVPARSHPPQSGGFSPGTLLIERYRIVALLGRGGMGDVYRAEDLKLGNVVALKFLPASLQNDTVALAGFHAEVRNARQVSHPNVCRVYDIGEVNGQHFLTMEYIDGEDLSSLLCRIGRLPPDKALETAHQICAGLHLFVLFFLRVLLRKQWAAAIAFVLLFTVFYSSTSQFALLLLANNLIVTGLTVFVLIRFGLLALVAAWVFVGLLNFPLTTQGSAWYAGISLTGILLMAAMTFYGFYTSLGGRPVFGGAVLEE